MLSILRMGDIATCGHAPIQGSPDVFANNIPITRACVDILNCPKSPPVKYAEGLHTVFVNDLPLVHIGDSNTHPGVAIQGSPNVFGDDMGTVEPAGVAVLRGLVGFETSFQPDTNRVMASEYGADDTDVDGPGTGTSNINRTIQRYEERKAGVKTVDDKVIATAPPSVNKAAAQIPTGCDDIADKPVGFDFYNPPFQLSPNFTVAQLSSNTLVSSYKLTPQQGLSVNDIVCNLRGLCINVLEPMKARYGSSMRVNSGFRVGAGTSQHNRGEAADISFSDAVSSSASFVRAQEITDGFNYDQYIFEQNNSIWHHVSYKSNGSQRRQILSKPRGNAYLPGLRQFA